MEKKMESEMEAGIILGLNMSSILFGDTMVPNKVQGFRV